MILALDSMGKRYGILPSQAMTQASTFDLFVLDAAMAYENMVNARANGKENISSQFSPEDLQAVMDKVKNNEN